MNTIYQPSPNIDYDVPIEFLGLIFQADFVPVIFGTRRIIYLDLAR